MADTYPKNTIDDNGLKKVWDMVMDRLGLKVDKEAGKGLSTNDYTTTEKDKLAGIANGAQVNTITSVAGKTGAVELTKSDVGLNNVGNFKAVSTSANQGLTDTEKTNARANIDASSIGDIESTKTVSGNPITVTDAAPINAEDITVDITPVQDLHGYDRPWAGGAGKNKLFVDGTSKYINGIDYTVNSNGLIYVNGISASSPSYAWVHICSNTAFNNLGLVPGQRYILTGNVEPTKGILFIERTNNVHVYDDTGNGVEFVYNGETNWRVGYVVNFNTSFNNELVAKPMIRLATEQDATFAPYSNECPIEGRTGAELDRVGKNLCDNSQNIWGYYDDSGNFVTSVQNKTSDLISVKSNTTYIASIFNKTTLSRVGGLVWTEWDKNGNFIQQKISESITTNENTLYVRVRNFNSDSSLITNNNYLYQLELGSSPTVYEPYQGQQYAADFGETVYGGKWHVTEGGTDKTHANIASYNGEAINEPWLSSLDEYSPGATPTTGAQVVYPLTTPTTISTPKQNVPMLQGINTVSADCGDTQLKYQPDNVIGELKGEIEDSIVYEDYKWTTESSQSYSAGTPGTYGTSSWRDVKKEGYDVIGVTFVENRRFGDCILTLYYIPSTSRVEVIIFRATSSAVTIADEDIEYRVAYKKRT